MPINEAASFRDAYSLLEEELATGTPFTSKIPSTLTLEEIHMVEEVLQPRGYDDLASKERHIGNLMESALGETNYQLDPLVVWWSGQRWLIVDGHHRLRAYQLLREKKGIKPRVPVRVFHGTLKDAFLESGRLNSKDKLPMTKDDKLNRAWQMVSLNRGFSKREISESCRIGSATVARMRKTLKTLLEQYPQEECTELPWRYALKLSQGEREIDDSWRNKQITEWAKRLKKTFGVKPVNQPELFWDALEVYSPKLVRELQEYLGVVPDDFENDDF